MNIDFKKKHKVNGEVFVSVLFLDSKKHGEILTAGKNGGCCIKKLCSLCIVRISISVFFICAITARAVYEL